MAGNALNPMVIPLSKQNKVKWIKMEHEGNTSFAAFAQGELNRNIDYLRQLSSHLSTISV